MQVNLQFSKCFQKLFLRSIRKQSSASCFDLKYLTNPSNLQEISENIQNRKGVGNIKLVQNLYEQLKNENLDKNERKRIEETFHLECSKIPNRTDPIVKNLEDPRVVQFVNEMPKFTHKPLEFSEICKTLNILRTDQLGNFTGPRSYYLMSDLAEMEQALIKYTLDRILKKGFQLITVPDILPPDIIKSCGMEVDGERNQIYKLTPSGFCLSGTSEMSLAGYFSGKKLKPQELPIKCTAVSRCYRAETSNVQEEKGIYRVHQFTKVEMFSICKQNQSESMLEEFKETEMQLFKDIGIHFQLLDMPPFELGAPAYRKYDIESWMPGRKMWGEISSCSNCTDYQSRRLNIQVENPNGIEYAHTVNGTACAIPRMLIAIIETFQQENGSIYIPKVLRSYMKKDKISIRKNLPKLKLVKNISV